MEDYHLSSLLFVVVVVVVVVAEKVASSAIRVGNLLHSPFRVLRRCFTCMNTYVHTVPSDGPNTYVIYSNIRTYT